MFLAIANAYLAESEVMSSYKEQSEIECSLRTVESFPEILPVYHVKSEKMRTHVFVGTLSLITLMPKVRKQGTGYR
jgi:transposase